MGTFCTRSSCNISSSPPFGVSLPTLGLDVGCLAVSSEVVQSGSWVLGISIYVRHLASGFRG